MPPNKPSPASPIPNTAKRSSTGQTAPKNKISISQSSSSLTSKAAIGGGVKLPTPPPQAASPSPKPPNHPSNAATTSEPRRKPRKLTRNPTTPIPPAQSLPPTALTTEIAALKARLLDLEAQVEALYSTSTPDHSATASNAAVATATATGARDQLPSKPPRRRGRSRGTPLPGTEEKLKTLEQELEGTKKELDSLRARQSKANTTSPNPKPPGPKAGRVEEEEGEEEEIPRSDGPQIEDAVSANITTTTPSTDRALTLTGHYRIPLPASVSLHDVRTIQNGISSANKIARELVDGARQQPRTQEREGSGTQNESWSSWIGGYSMSVARFVNRIEADAAVEEEGRRRVGGGDRPAAGGRRRTAPALQHGGGAERATAGKNHGQSQSQNQNQPKRPPARTRGSNARLSEKDVETLMA